MGMLMTSTSAQNPSSSSPTPSATQPANSENGTPAWVQRSNQNAMLLLRTVARFDPESSAELGVENIDDQISDLSHGFRERRREAVFQVETELKRRLVSEKDPLVAQDLEILIKSAAQDIKGSELQQKYQIPYYNVAAVVFGSMHGLLNDQVAHERYAAALVRLKRYTGMEQGYKPLSQLAIDDTRAQLNQPGLIGPIQREVETNLAQTDFFLDGIKQLFEKYKVAGYEEPLARFKEQIAAYNDFLKKEVLPKSRKDFRLPPELYDFALEQFGIDISKEQLVAKAHTAFTEIQAQMQQLAPAVAKEKGLKVTDYRDVIRELKKKQIVGEDILPFYQHRLADIEQIIRREHLVTLPARPARIRLASAAESAQIPAPHMQPPRLLNNHGEQGEFVLPLNLPTPPGSKEAMSKLDDFTFDAASWTITAHEARPGHELQFDSMIEHGVSIARAVYAFNSTNVEGWGLYSEYITFPYMPPEGQLICLQLRLQRAARAFIDPELQMGKLTPEDAMRILTHDVGLSTPFANSEVERYTFRMPGQANSYFYGYIRLLELRKDAEKVMGQKFDPQKFHDFILAQGLLAPDQLRKAVFADFVGMGTGTGAGK